MAAAAWSWVLKMLHEHQRTCVCTRVFVCVCLRECACACACMHVRARERESTPNYAQRMRLMRMHACMCMCVPTSAPKAVRVSMSTAVWMVMCREPMILAPFRLWAVPNSDRQAMRPGISASAISISRRPKSCTTVVKEMGEEKERERERERERGVMLVTHLKVLFFTSPVY